MYMHNDFMLCFQPASPLNGERSPHENGPEKKKDGPSSPRSDGSSHASTPSSKHKDVRTHPELKKTTLFTVF